MQISFSNKKYGNSVWLVAKIKGEIDMAVAGDFRQKLQDKMDISNCHNLLLNMRDVTFIDSSGLGVILGRYRQMAAMGGKIAISGAKENVYRLLLASGLDKIIQIDKPENLWRTGEVKK